MSVSIRIVENTIGDLQLTFGTPLYEQVVEITSKYAARIASDAQQNLAGSATQPTYLHTKITFAVRQKLGEVTGVSGTDIFYAPFVEFGTAQFAEGPVPPVNATGIYPRSAKALKIPINAARRGSYSQRRKALEAGDFVLRGSVSGQHPQLYLTKAFDANKDGWVEELGSAFNAAWNRGHH